MKTTPEHSIDWELAGKYLQGETTEAEGAQFASWLSADPDHTAFFESARKMWEQTGMIQDEGLLDGEWQHFQQRAGLTQPTKAIPMYRRLPMWTRIAASILLLAGLGWWGLEQMNDQGPVVWSEVVTQVGQQSEINLPDGTIVFLNGNSRLVYPPDYGNSSREIKLEGEAFFEVARDENRPFRIQSGNSITQVLGTSFNVNAMHTADSVVVNVTSGKVALYALNDPANRVELQKGESGKWTGSKGLVQSRKWTSPHFQSWQTGVLTFSSTPLPAVYRALEKQYRVSCVVPEELAACKLTAQFDHQSLDDVLRELEIVFKVRHERITNNITVRGTGC